MDYLIGMGERFADTSTAFEREANILRSADGALSLVFFAHEILSQ